MIDERYKDYFKILSMYHRQSQDERPKMLAGYVKASSMVHTDLFTRELLVKFHFKESQKYAQSITPSRA